MARHPIPAPAGVTEVLQILDVFSNPEKYREMVLGLEKIREEVNEGVRKMNLKGDVDQMLAAAKTKNESANKRLETATEKAEKLVADATAKAEALVQDAQAAADHITRQSQERIEKIESDRKQLDARSKALDEKEEQYAKDVRALQEQQRELSAVQNEYKAKVESLERVLASTRG